MEVEVLRQTQKPERLVCQAARGDYYEGYVGDTEYAEIMEPIDYNEQHLDGLAELCYPNSRNARLMMQANLDTENLSNKTITEAKTRAFIEEQLTRGHYGPLEHPQITFSVKGVSRVTMAQITRHRNLTFDIQSMRYADFSEQEIAVPATLLSDEERHERYPHVYDEDGFHFNRDEGVFEMMLGRSCTCSICDGRRMLNGKSESYPKRCSTSCLSGCRTRSNGTLRMGRTS